MEKTNEQPPQPEEEVINPGTRLLTALGEFMNNTFTVEGVDKLETMESIRKDVSFRGFNVWILICSILICSIGLNQNSTAVIIGAMLISPLMGPINGMGLAIGVYDRALFIKSLYNLLIAVGVSVLTSFVFFSLMPVEEAQHELLSRTRPIFLDIFVALFGGIAGILASSRSIKSNVIPGVAIATALMPPLCTAGYGLATGQWNYFGGAFYLFFINSVMISTAAFMIVRYLKFPFKEYVNSKKRLRVKWFMFIVIILVSVPSFFIYLNIYKQATFKKNARDFIDTEIVGDREVEVISRTVTQTDSGRLISIGLLGEKIPKEEIERIKSKATNYNLSEVQLKIYQMSSDSLDDRQILDIRDNLRVGIIEDLYQKNAENLSKKEDEIALLKSELVKATQDRIPEERLTKLVFNLFDEIETFAVSNHQIYQEGADSLGVVFVHWEKSKSRKSRQKDEARLVELMKIETNQPAWKVVSF
jgi:uncharacterized hydrophobic protein (TIGR00271 family)